VTDPECYTPSDADAALDEPTVLGGASPIAYLGLALTRDEFTAYVRSLAWPTTRPSWLVMHHTAIPAASWAPYGAPLRWWDAAESGMSDPQKVAKRLRQLRAIFTYYQNTLGWRAGPHLFVDDLRIYVGTPLTQAGIHAAYGNTSGATYSLGIEVIGYYEHVGWPGLVMQNVAHAAATLHNALGTFELETGKGPGFVSEHRMYNKPACPGAKVRAPDYLPHFRKAAQALAQTPAVAFSADSTLIGRAVAPDAEVIRAWARLCRARGTPYTDHDLLHVIGPEYAKLCNLTGLRLPLVFAQCAHETGWMTSFWSQRPQRNPAGIGVNGEKRQTEPQQSGWAFNPQRQQWEKGLSFPTWQEDAIPAHVGRLLAYAVPAGQRTGEQQRLIERALRWRALPISLHGSAPTLRQLGVVWASPGLDYGEKVARAANAILAEV
jgi:hypothetical protein